MIKRNELLAAMTRAEMNQRDVSNLLHITPKTFRAKLKKGVFNSDEITIMIKRLNIENPMEIFFAD